MLSGNPLPLQDRDVAATNRSTDRGGSSCSADDVFHVHGSTLQIPTSACQLRIGRRLHIASLRSARRPPTSRMSESTTLGFRIRTLREQRGLDQAVLADAVGTARTHLTNVERDRTKPGRDLLVAIANFFDVSLDWLTSGVGSVQRATAANADEALLLFAYRQLPEPERKAHLNLLLSRTGPKDA